MKTESGYQFATKWLRNIFEEAELGNSCAQLRLGLCYLFGSELRQDENKAFEWVKRSAERGFVPAQRFLGEFRSEERRVGKECRSRWSPYH